MKLTETEETLMQYLWDAKKAFMKDLLDTYPEPKPAPTTVATLLKRMIDKGFVAYREYGNSREYYPLIEKNDYFSKQMNGMIHKFFNNSVTQFASFFTSKTDFSATELEELKSIIDKQIEKKKK
ncbi:BlaI/MecI/CopY family transcriptional regulator [Emticicia sp. SJ17W-69]|uniref:BlaI/MecI/CopY family transcriptional regulator n=1 Tax=Emticicia sp. SJ17W-69 TaxID=3421657 RepID=UPI003EBE9387